MDEKQQELIFKLSMFEQQIGQMQQQMQAIEHGIIDLSIIRSGLDELIEPEGKEIVAPIGKGIFVNAKITSEDLMVDIGGKNLVKKNVPETKKMISEQIKKLEEIKKELVKNIEKMGKEASCILEESEKIQIHKGEKGKKETY